MTDTFDAVLAEMREYMAGNLHKLPTDPDDYIGDWIGRLAAAHAAEVGERDAHYAELAKLRELCGCAYQLAGCHDAPEAWMDALSDAANGIPLAEWRVQGDLVETLLPYTPPAAAPRVECERCRGRGTLMGGRVICECTCARCGGPSIESSEGCPNHPPNAENARTAEDWVLVPREPTDAMKLAGAYIWPGVNPKGAAETYRAMLTAALAGKERA